MSAASGAAGMLVEDFVVAIWLLFGVCAEERHPDKPNSKAVKPALQTGVVATFALLPGLDQNGAGSF